MYVGWGTDTPTHICTYMFTLTSFAEAHRHLEGCAFHSLSSVSLVLHAVETVNDSSVVAFFNFRALCIISKFLGILSTFEYMCATQSFMY